MQIKTNESKQTRTPAESHFYDYLVRAPDGFNACGKWKIQRSRASKITQIQKASLIIFEFSIHLQFKELTRDGRPMTALFNVHHGRGLSKNWFVNNSEEGWFHLNKSQAHRNQFQISNFITFVKSCWILTRLKRFLWNLLFLCRFFARAICRANLGRQVILWPLSETSRAGNDCSSGEIWSLSRTFVLCTDPKNNGPHLDTQQHNWLLAGKDSAPQILAESNWFWSSGPAFYCLF